MKLSDRAAVLVDLIREHGWQHGAELGVEAGKTHLALLRSCPRLYLIGVDTWRGRKAGEPRASMYPKLRRRVRRYGPRSRLLRTTTLDAAPLVEDGSLDFVFVDADHIYRAVRSDILAWRSKLRPDGWLTGHDWDLPGVDRAIRELCPGHYRYPKPAKVWTIPVRDLP